MNTPSISELISYLNDELPVERQQELDKFIEEHPHYQDVLASLMHLLAKYETKELVLAYLEDQKKRFMQQYFKNDE